MVCMRLSLAHSDTATEGLSAQHATTSQCTSHPQQRAHISARAPLPVALLVVAAESLGALLACKGPSTADKLVTRVTVQLPTILVGCPLSSGSAAELKLAIKHCQQLPRSEAHRTWELDVANMLSGGAGGAHRFMKAHELPRV